MNYFRELRMFLSECLMTWKRLAKLALHALKL